MVSEAPKTHFINDNLNCGGKSVISKEEWINEVLKKPKDVFKSRQIYYSSINDGKITAKLSKPRPLNTDTAVFHKANSIKWPLNFEIIRERIVHINQPPPGRERLYQPTGKEYQPAVSSDDTNSTVVFQYEPMVGKFFTTSKINGNSGQPIHPSIDSKFLKFESRFECGNLSKAICTGPCEYELHLRPDLYTKKYTQWFYFSVQNAQNTDSYRFTIVNFYKSTSLFGQGMRPLMYSEKMARLTGIGWRRVGSDISYYQTKFTEPTENGLSSMRKFLSNSKRSAYSLTWKFNFPYPNDIVYFAACYPYTYTQLQEYLNELAMNSKIRRICQQTTLCYTLANNPVPLLTITEPCNNNEQYTGNKTESTVQSQSTDDQSVNKKRCVVITARVHPGETQGSWMMKGLIEFLISEDPDAKILRSNFVFKLVPMLNPDGVIVGNYRCSLSGCDLNRKYTSNLKKFFPTIWHTKHMIIDIMKQYEVVVYCDLHGHSRQQQMFIYGCKGETPEQRYCSRIFPAMLGKNIPELFNFDKCKFSVQKEKEGTGRIVMWREGIMNSYTLEATFCGTAGNDLEAGYHFNSFDFEKIGSHFCDTLLDYIDPDNQKIEYIQQYLRDRVVSSKKLKRSGSEDEDDGLTSDDSMSDSSDTGSDSSNCDELPAYYAYLLQKPKKKIKRKSRTSSLKSSEKVKLVNKKVTEPRKDSRTGGHCAVCQKGIKSSEESSKTRKQTDEKERNIHYWRPPEGQQNGYVSDGIIPSTKNHSDACSSIDKSQDMICLKPYYEAIKKADHDDHVSMRRYSTSLHETVHRDQTLSTHEKLLRRESQRYSYQFTYQDLEIPKIDIGSECFAERLIRLRRACSAPSTYSFKHNNTNNKRSNSCHYKFNGHNDYLNRNGNKSVSGSAAALENVNGYISDSSGQRYSDIRSKGRSRESDIFANKNHYRNEQSHISSTENRHPLTNKSANLSRPFGNKPSSGLPNPPISNTTNFKQNTVVTNEYKNDSREKSDVPRLNESNAAAYRHLRKALGKIAATHNGIGHFTRTSPIMKSNSISSQNCYNNIKTRVVQRLSCGLKLRSENTLEDTISLNVKPIPILQKRNL
ncbi:unnamed protein product [Trichobilharzia szidati]|nr:unnamed protein product [Trichobilharzia szidati]